MWTITHRMMNEATRRLQTVKLLHTMVWAVFAGCVVTMPWLTSQRKFGAAAVLATIVLGEVVVLWYHRWSCPLTAVAARYTDDRRANFDIYLPEWLARHNQRIFGSLYVIGVAYLVLSYLGDGTG
jgi:polyferredoxin